MTATRDNLQVSPATIETPAPAQPDEAKSPRKPAASQALLRVAKMLKKAGADSIKQGRVAESLDYCERAVLAEFRAELLAELRVISLTLVGIEGSR